MTRQNLNIGAAANDGTGDTLREAGLKINQNFAELYEAISGDSGQVSTGVFLTNTGIEFEGSTVNGTRTTVAVTNPTAARTVTIPNASGTVVLDTLTQTLTNKTLTAPILSAIDIQDNDQSHVYNVVPGSLTANTNINIPSLSDSDTFVLTNTNQTLTNKTLTSPVLNTPRVGTSIDDTSGNELIKVTATTSAVNEITIANAATGNAPIISATGGDTNVGIAISGKGTGSVSINKLALSSNAQTADGAVSPSHSFIIFNKSSALAATLANGTTTGEYKIMANEGTGLVTVTPASFAQGTSLSLAQYGSTQVVWSGSYWFMLGGADSSNAYVTITA